MGFQRFFILMSLLIYNNLPTVGQTVKHTKVDSINSIYDEQNPVISPNGNKIYFTRSGHSLNVGGVRDKGDIWYAEKKATGGWSTPKHAGKTINHNGLDGVVGISQDGNTIYLLNHGESRSVNSQKGISKSTWEQGIWSKPEKLPIRYFSNRSEHISGFVTPDEKVMVLSIQSFQTYGNEDLYVSFSEGDGRWSQPLNLGQSLNTPAEEWSPYLTLDTKTIYFSSNGHKGFGSRDIFMAKRLDETWTNWSKPVNLGDSINTKGVELGYFIPNNGSAALISSTQNSEGFGDIFKVPLSEKIQAVQQVNETVAVVEEPAKAVQKPVIDSLPSIVTMRIQVLDVNNDQPVSAIVVFDYDVQQKIVNTNNLKGDDKLFEVSFIEGKEVNVSIEAAGYLKYQEKFTVTASNELDSLNVIEVFKLIPEKVGTAVSVENVLFKRGLPFFADSLSAQKELDKLVSLMTVNPSMEIRLEGHTDNRGRADLNQKLSEARVAYIKEYLTSKGIAENRVQTIGYGGSKPIASNGLESSRMLNRRVEFVITKSKNE